MITDLPLPRVVGAALAALPRKQFSDFGLPDDMALAGIVLTSTGKHHLVLGTKFHNLRPDQQAHICLHEFTHLAAGHCLRAIQLKLDPQRWNIATDAWINEVHPYHLTQELNGILYGELRNGLPAKPPTAQCPQGIPARPPIPELPHWLIDPLDLYKLLEETFPPNLGNGMDVMMVSELEEGTEAQAGLEILKARAILREAAKEDPTLQRIVDELGASPRGSTSLYTKVEVAAWLEQIYQQITHLAQGKQGDLVRRRGWKREGRVEGYAGTTRRRSLHVMVALDVSGSTSGWWGSIIAACRGITQRHLVDIVCHSDMIVYRGPAVPLEAPVGGGTMFEPVTKAAQLSRPDCVIWVTDGESSDRPTLPDCPIYWVWLPSSRKWNLRAQDYQVEYSA